MKRRKFFVLLFIGTVMLVFVLGYAMAAGRGGCLKAGYRIGITFRMNGKLMNYSEGSGAVYMDKKTKVYGSLGRNSNIDIVFPGDKPGHWNKAGFSTPAILLNIGNNSFVSLAGQPLIIKVIQYGRVGAYVKGTFSGKLAELNTRRIVHVITQGKFYVKRMR